MLRPMTHVDPRPAPEAVSAVSFAGCAWLLTYHFGVAHALRREGVIDARTIFLGASSGSIVAASLAADIDPRDSFEATRACARRVDGRLLGPAGRMTNLVEGALEQMLPHDAHERVAGRFFASLTRVSRLRNQLAPRRPLRSRRELIELVLASCYIPLYYERPSVWRGHWYVDGGVTDNLPRHAGPTLTVSPTTSLRSAPAHVQPRHAPPWHAVLFPRDHGLCALFEQGIRDGEDYVRTASSRGARLPR